MAFNPWSDKDTATARALLRRDADRGEFIKVLGRTKSAAVMRIRWLDNPAVRDRTAARSRASRSGTSGLVVYDTRPKSIPARVLADAARRSNADRTITAFICGDPAPGQSALDRRQPAEALV